MDLTAALFSHITWQDSTGSKQLLGSGVEIFLVIRFAVTDQGCNPVHTYLGESTIDSTGTYHIVGVCVCVRTEQTDEKPAQAGLGLRAESGRQGPKTWSRIGNLTQARQVCVFAHVESTSLEQLLYNPSRLLG